MINPRPKLDLGARSEQEMEMTTSEEETNNK